MQVDLMVDVLIYTVDWNFKFLIDLNLTIKHHYLYCWNNNNRKQVSRSTICAPQGWWAVVLGLPLASLIQHRKLRSRIIQQMVNNQRQKPCVAFNKSKFQLYNSINETWAIHRINKSHSCDVFSDLVDNKTIWTHFIEIT